MSKKSEVGGGEGDVSGMRGPLSSPAVYLSENRGRCKEMAFFKKLLLLGVNEIHEMMSTVSSIKF